VRKVSGYIIGHDLLSDEADARSVVNTEPQTSALIADPPTKKKHEQKPSTGGVKDVLGGGIRITQTLYQSQRRWIGIGWTSNLFPNERSPWSLVF
jgi:Integral peroxisomal membrane peroxin